MSYARYGNLGTDRRTQPLSQYGPMYRTSSTLGTNGRVNNTVIEQYGAPQPPNRGQESGPMLYGVPEITSKEEKLNFIQNNKVCVIYVYGNFCGPCKAMAPKYAQLASELKGRAMLVKEEVQQGLSPHVTAVPYFEIYVNGQKTNDAINNDFNMLVEKLKSLNV